jgi:hypothetical protein
MAVAGQRFEPVVRNDGGALTCHPCTSLVGGVRRRWAVNRELTTTDMTVSAHSMSNTSGASSGVLLDEGLIVRRLAPKCGRKCATICASRFLADLSDVYVLR